MRDPKVTKLTIREDWPVSITSSMGQANLTAVGFNIELIMRHRPSLAIEITKLFEQARWVRPEDPDAPEEDVRSVAEEWARFVEAIARN
jgi:hypothetical protein